VVVVVEVVVVDEVVSGTVTTVCCNPVVDVGTRVDVVDSGIVVDGTVVDTSSVAVVGGLVVAYRCKYNSQSQKWGKVKMTGPIHVVDIIGNHNINPAY
jgi:hypothetical protein